MATFIVVVATYVVTKTLMVKWYQATAIIEPVPEGAVENRVEGGLGGLGGGGMASLLMSTGIDSQAQEYLTILRSYTFNTEVAEHHNLTEELLRDNQDEKPKTIRKLKMKLFDVAKARFKVDYSLQARNLSVHFIDRDPVRAQEILQYYLDDLRELQRAQEIKNATAAITSLDKEARATAIRCSGKASMLWSRARCSVKSWPRWRPISPSKSWKLRSRRTDLIRHARVSTAS